MRANDDGFAILNIWFEALKPIGTRSSKTVEVQHPFTSKHFGVMLYGFKWSVEFPAAVNRIEIMRRDEDFEPVLLCSSKDVLHVLNSIVFLDTITNDRPCETFFTQHIILRIDEYHCCIILAKFY